MTLAGSIPGSWGSETAFPQLEVLDLSHNRLQGSVPVFHNRGLHGLNLHDCNLSSDLRSFWNSTAPLQAVSLANNAITGALPSSSGSLAQLAFFDIQGNQVQGTVPLSWLLPDSFMAHVSYFSLGRVWKHSAQLTDWKQQVCLKPDLYNPDILAQQLQALPDLQESSLQVSDAEFQSLLGGDHAQWVAQIQNGSLSTKWLAAKLRGLDNPWTGQIVTSNQLTTVRAICTNHSSSKVLLSVWVFLGACCMMAGFVYVIAECCRGKEQSSFALVTSLVVFGFRSISESKAVVVAYPTLKGLAGLAFYYYDLVTSIIVLTQVWDKWPGHILAAIFFLHFATTGLIVATHVLVASSKTWFSKLQASPGHFAAMVLLCLICCPFTIPAVILLDTVAFASHLLTIIRLLAGFCFSRMGFKPKIPDRLRKIGDALVEWLGFDLEDYETMHNLIAAVLQSLPTVVLNSVLLSLGNKPSHGIFLSNRLFVAAVVASCLAMLNSVAVMLWESYHRSVSPKQHAFDVVTGKRLRPGHEVLKRDLSQTKRLTQVEVFLQQLTGSRSLTPANLEASMNIVLAGLRDIIVQVEVQTTNTA